MCYNSCQHRSFSSLSSQDADDRPETSRQINADDARPTQEEMRSSWGSLGGGGGEADARYHNQEETECR
jgi:hypothetical protein